VRTGLTPGQEKIDAFMPLDAFIDEVMALLTLQPRPAELIVERARFMRGAEAESRFQDALTTLNSH
jgi:uncharacterized oxidoreductase